VGATGKRGLNGVNIEKRPYEITLLSVRLSLPIVARQQVGKHVSAVSLHTEQWKKLLDASYQRKAGDYLFPELLVLYIYITNITL
jgi:hypothetical protein